MADKDESGELQVGDVVKLASGGPKMTIESFSYRGAQAFCKWFVKQGGAWEMKTAVFDVETLVDGEADDRSRD